MYSGENIRSRFSGTSFKADMADNFICVRHLGLLSSQMSLQHCLFCLCRSRLQVHAITVILVFSFCLTVASGMLVAGYMMMGMAMRILSSQQILIS